MTFFSRVAILLAGIAVAGLVQAGDPTPAADTGSHDAKSALLSIDTPILDFLENPSTRAARSVICCASA
jgi:hypothetical protein